MIIMISNIRSAPLILVLLSIANILQFLSVALIVESREISTDSVSRNVEQSVDKSSGRPQRFQNTNVVILLADNLAYDDVGVFRGPQRANANAQPQDLQLTKDSRTPNLDRAALEGRRLLNWNSPAVLCSASRAALLTGE